MSKINKDFFKDMDVYKTLVTKEAYIEYLYELLDRTNKTIINFPDDYYYLEVLNERIIELNRLIKEA